MALKRKAVATATVSTRIKAKTKPTEETEVPEEEVEVEPEVKEEETAEQREEELRSERRKELKAMYAEELKQLAVSNGLQVTKKEEIIEALLSHEANLRAAAKEHEARLRSVVIARKEELERMAIGDLKDLCISKGIKGVLTKQVRVEQLLAIWQQEGGVDKALAKLSLDAREAELATFEKKSLLEICTKAGVDPFVKEVMVDRILKQEQEAGRFARPVPEKDSEADEDVTKGKDLVEALLANESKRKKEQATRQQREEELANLRKDIKALSLDDLKKKITEKGHTIPAGKKEELVEALLAISLKEQELAVLKAKLKALSIEDLKSKVLSKGLHAQGKKEELIEALLQHKAKVQADFLASEALLAEILAKKKEEFEAKTAAELKDLCANKGLKLGVGKEDRIERLMEDAKSGGELDKVFVQLARASRREALSAMDTSSLQKLCEELRVDPLVKELMIERILSHESEFGVATTAGPKVVEPASKRSRMAWKGA
jgi:hypothetical protein